MNQFSGSFYQHLFSMYIGRKSAGGSHLSRKLRCSPQLKTQKSVFIIDLSPFFSSGFAFPSHRCVFLKLFVDVTLLISGTFAGRWDFHGQYFCRSAHISPIAQVDRRIILG